MNFFQVLYLARVDKGVAFLYIFQFSLSLLSMYCSYFFFNLVSTGIGEGVTYFLSIFLLVFGLGMLIMLFAELIDEYKQVSLKLSVQLVDDN